MTSDYFDRLLARYTPTGRAVPAAPSGGARPVRVRPRLAGPFERVEALRGEPETDGPPGAPVPPVSPPRPAPGDAGRGPRPVREIHTERHTVVRDAAPAPDGQPARAGKPQPPAGNGRLKPSPPALRPVPDPPGRRSTRASAPRDADGSGERAPRAARPALVDRDGEAAARSAASRTGGDGLPAERGARQHAAAARRGGARPTERVVHVQIGRLEVSAATPPGAGRAAAGSARQRAGRTAPTVSLDDYLARGRNGERSN